MKKIRLGIIGCGWVSKFYSVAVRDLAARCEWAWGADPNLDAAKEFCAENGGEARIDFQGGGADAVIIATPHHLHVSQYLALAPTGVAVLLEKPLALSLEEADKMIAARDAAKGLLMVGYVNRYRSGPRTVHAAIAEGRIGKPLFWDATQFCNQPGYVGGWLSKKATLGGGVFFSSSGHLLDLLTWFNGPVEHVKLETAHYRLAMEGEDTQLSLVRFKNGCLATMRESWCANGVAKWQTINAYGTEGSLEMSYTPRGTVFEGHKVSWDAHVRLRRDGQKDEVLLEENGPFDFTGQLAHFLDCIEQKRQPMTTAEMAREVIAVTRRAEAAMEKGM